jgi:hypothetical protein
MPSAVQPGAVARATTSELFPALDRSARVVTLQQLFDAAPGEALPLGLGLQLGAAVAERVALIHTAGRAVGQLDAARVRISVDGRVSLARHGEGAVAPELKPGGPGTLASDVYAVGYLCHQLLTGNAPMPSVLVPPSRFNPQLDAEVDAVLLAALRDVPEERPASVMALQAALEGLAEELGLKADPQGLGKIVEKLMETGIKAPRRTVQSTPALSPVADAWLESPGPLPAVEDDEEPDEELTSQTPQPKASWLIGTWAAAAVMMLFTAVAMGVTGGSVDPQSQHPAAVAPLKHAAPVAVAEAPAPKPSAFAKQHPGPQPAPKRRHRHHR